MERSRQRGVRGEGGQAAVFVSMIIFTLVLFAALATNTGIVVNDRIRMQNTADLSSYAGAVVQAHALNKMAEHNRQIVEYTADLRDILLSTIWWPEGCGCPSEHSYAETLITMYQTFINMETIPIEMYNSMANTWAQQAARDTANANFEGTGDAGRISYLPGSPAYYFPLLDGGELDRLEGDTQVTYYFIRCCPCGPDCCFCFVQEVTKTIDTWYYRNSDYHVYFPVRVKGTPNYRFLDIMNAYFGADAGGGSDELWAYAVSKPYGGNIGTDDPGNCGPPNPSSCLPYFPFFENIFRDQYRARIVGVQEDLEPDVRPLITTDCASHPVEACSGEWMEH